MWPQRACFDFCVCVFAVKGSVSLFQIVVLSLWSSCALVSLMMLRKDNSQSERAFTVGVTL